MTDIDIKAHVDEKRQIGLTAHQIEGELGVDIDHELLHIGHQVIARQKEETFIQTWRNHWKGACWSLFVSMALWMEGYDQSIVNSFFAQAQFKKDFGDLANGKYTIPANKQTILTNTAICGQLVGIAITGYCQEKYGAKITYFCGMLFMIVAIFPAVFASSINVLYAAEFIMGMPWGMFQTLATAYAMAWASMGWGGGRFIASGVAKATLHMGNSWAWRLPYALQWIWPVPLVALIWLAPESPWWLVRQGRIEDAKKVIRRTARSGFYTEEEIAGYAEYMKHTDALDRSERAKGSFFDMWKGTNLRRTEIQLGVWAVQIWNGSSIVTLNVLFLTNAGMAADFAFSFSMIINALSIVGVLVSWWLLRYFGRRPIYLWGLVSIIVPNLIIGILGVAKINKQTSLAIGILMAFINFSFHFSLGPVCYTIVGEVPAGRLRAQSIAFGRFVYIVNSIVLTTLQNYMMVATAWNWGAKAGWFWVGMGSICLLWSFFRLPETGGFSFSELDILFANRVPARKFTSVNITDELADNNAATFTQSDIDKKNNVEHIEGPNKSHVLDT